ncbi:MAG: hypothetical protein IJ682_08070 [Lachnospiraceae bacterium]|nr:hypothetical protein [Lachnospiraceae bacterium]
MADRDYKAFIVEGEVREPQIIDNISKVFFAHGDFKIITLPAEENIYMLWKKLKADDFDTDIIEVLRESSDVIREQLTGFSRDDFSEVYLFFDYDIHQTNLGKEDDADAVAQMLKSFDNETENGKLYISYPMVESLRDYSTGECGNKEACYVAVEQMTEYKNASSVRSANPHFREYDYEIWKDIIDVFAMRVSCLFGSVDTLEYERYSEEARPYNIYVQEEKKRQKGRVFVLSAFPEFLVDYYGVKLWRTCVKHKKNRRKIQGC